MSAVRHKASTRALVQRLAADECWSVGDIRRLLEREGVDPLPSRNTLWCWMNPDGERRERARSRRNSAARRRPEATYRWPGTRTPEWRFGRMQALAETGLSNAAISKVMSLDFPDAPLTENQVRYMLATGEPSRALRAVA